MNIHPSAGKVADPSVRVAVQRLLGEYYDTTSTEPVLFGTSGHRGSSLKGSFNEGHVLSITQAICDYRLTHGIDGPLFLGIDTHALSEPASISALEVLSANGVDVWVDASGGFTPTPVVSHAILSVKVADGVVITPSHNPPEYGGFKYNPPHGGPAEAAVTKWIERRANEILGDDIPRKKPNCRAYDFLQNYVSDLDSVIDMNIIKSSGLRIGVDPMGGAGVSYWEAIAERYGLDIKVTNRVVDPTFRFMTVDYDGEIRMDCSSRYAMSQLIGLKDQFDIAWANDTDSDRHGIVTPSRGLVGSNDYLALSIDYLFQNRNWPVSLAIGKTLVSSSLIDRVVTRLNRKLVELPVGFKWFVPGLLEGEIGFAGEESAGAVFLRRDGSVWTTDKDGIIMGLLAAEMMSKTEKDVGELYSHMTEALGKPLYDRIDILATPEQKKKLSTLSSSEISVTEIAGFPILQILTQAPSNKALIDGVKVVTEHGWFAVRPSGTEDVYKLYAESFIDEGHLKEIQEDAQNLVNSVLL